MSPNRHKNSDSEDDKNDEKIVQSKGAKVLVDAVSGKVRTAKLKPKVSFEPVKDDNDPLLGKEIDGYRLLERIAEGGMGYIYKACSTDDSDILRAMKILRPELSEHPSLVHRFQREARVLRRLSHPRIVALESSGYFEGVGHYMCQEWLSGYSLKQLYRSYRSLFPQKQIYRWVEQLGHALHFAHKKNVIHRDVKPDNIFLLTGEDDSIYAEKGVQKSLRLIDFGIAVMLDESPLPEEVAGTPRYMAPEQILGEKISPQTDFYAFGHLLFELLTRRPVFPYKESDKLKRAHLHELPPSLGEVRPDLLFPPELEAVVRRLLEKRPENRPISFPDFFQELGVVLLKKEITRRSGRMGLAIGGSHSPELDDAPTPPPTTSPKQQKITELKQSPSSVSDTSNQSIISNNSNNISNQPIISADPFLDAFVVETKDDSAPPQQQLFSSTSNLSEEEHNINAELVSNDESSVSFGSPILLVVMGIIAFIMLTGIVWAFLTFF